MLLFLSVIENEVIRTHLEDIYYLYKKELWYVAKGILHDEYEAEDVVQTALIKVSEYIDEDMDVKCNKTKGLMVIIVRNLSINIYNQRKRRATINIDGLEEVLADESNEAPETYVLRLDQSKWIADQLSQVKREYADIMTLKYVYEYSNKEISEMLSISEGNVRIRITRAKKALQKIIGGEISG